MEKLELTKEEIVILDFAIWNYYHRTIEELKDEKFKQYEKSMINDLDRCENLLNKIKEIAK